MIGSRLLMRFALAATLLALSLMPSCAWADATIGVTLQPDSLTISEVFVGRAAERSGLRPGDVILRVDGQQLASYAEFRTFLASAAPGRTVRLTIFRNGSVMEAPLTLEQRESDSAALPAPAQSRVTPSPETEDACNGAGKSAAGKLSARACVDGLIAASDQMSAQGRKAEARATLERARGYEHFLSFGQQFSESTHILSRMATLPDPAAAPDANGTGMSDTSSNGSADVACNPVATTSSAEGMPTPSHRSTASEVGGSASASLPSPPGADHLTAEELTSICHVPLGTPIQQFAADCETPLYFAGLNAETKQNVDREWRIDNSLVDLQKLLPGGGSGAIRGALQNRMAMLKNEVAPTGNPPSGELPRGTYISTVLGPQTSPGNYGAQQHKWLKVLGGGKYMLDSQSGTFNRQGDTIQFLTGPLNSTYAEMVCTPGGGLELKVHLDTAHPNSLNLIAYYAYSEGHGCI